MTNTSGKPTWNKARCTCGAVEIKVKVDIHAAGTWRCNCTKCTKRGSWSVGVPIDAVEIVAGQADVVIDPPHPVWRGRRCSKCHAVLFGVLLSEEAGGPRNTVNVRMLEDVPLEGVPVVWLDGLNDSWTPLGTTIHHEPSFL